MLFTIFAIISVIIFIFYIYCKFSCVRCESNVCLVGKTALVTGGSSGIGYQIVLSLLARGCKVIVADRIINENLKQAIINETDNPNVVLEYVDFGSFKSVRNFAEKLINSENKLDILVNNVGIGTSDLTPSEDGLRLTMQVNYYSPILLTHLLIGLLKKSTDARILFTSSLLSYFSFLSSTKITTKTIDITGYQTFDYTISKFYTIIASDIFAKKLEKTNVKSNVYHPTIVNTNIFVQAESHCNILIIDIFAYLVLRMLLFFGGQSPKNACQIAVNMVVSKDFAKVTGTFFGVFFPNSKPKGSEDKKMCETIWEATENIIQLKPNEKI